MLVQITPEGEGKHGGRQGARLSIKYWKPVCRTITGSNTYIGERNKSDLAIWKTLFIGLCQYRVHCGAFCPCLASYVMAYSWGLSEYLHWPGNGKWGSLQSSRGLDIGYKVMDVIFLLTSAELVACLSQTVDTNLGLLDILYLRLC